MATKGFLKGAVSRQLVGAEDKERRYQGPVAEVTFDDTWLHICTDPYEGSAMLNIEALPYLRRALARIVAARKGKRSA